jgi:hypothetical protein
MRGNHGLPPRPARPCARHRCCHRVLTDPANSEATRRRPVSPPDEQRRKQQNRELRILIFDVSSLASRRLASYRLDTPSPPLVSLRERWFSAVRRVRHLRARTRLDLVDLGWSTVLDVSAKERSRRPDRRRSLVASRQTSNSGLIAPWFMLRSLRDKSRSCAEPRRTREHG